MKSTICEMASAAGYRDERWRRHASDCPDCGELLAVVGWMTKFADTTPALRLPSPGLILFKAKIEKNLLSADRAVRPIHAMVVLAGLLFPAVTLGIVLGTETRFAAILIETANLLLSFGSFIVIGSVIVALACVAAYLAGAQGRS